jgi:formylglycine-generating enzyme required for sulfatase activity
MKNQRVYLTLFLSAASIVALGIALNLLSATEFDILGRIESLGKDRTARILFEAPPAEKIYYVVKDRTVYATVEISAVEYDRNGKYRYRAAARITLTNRMYSRLIRAGEDIALVKAGKRADGETSEILTVEEPGYLPAIVSPKDKKAMVLIPEGKFVFGSGSGDRDESPEQVVFLENYYIDKYEVSNAEYEAFVESANSSPPLSWKGKTYAKGEGNLPVLVSYYEAEAYARWAGKRLATEEEWEKAARGIGRWGSMTEGKNYLYPWGRDFNPELANCEDFWGDAKTGAHMKMRFGISAAGLMPVDSFDPEGASPYGVVNMAGNAREWTSSWYLPYQGNRSTKGKEYRRYGKQYKVVRGGAWYSPKYRLRVSSREPGGIPNLHGDNTAGFRCVKNVDAIDVENK